MLRCGPFYTACDTLRPALHLFEALLIVLLWFCIVQLRAILLHSAFSDSAWFRLLSFTQVCTVLPLLGFLCFGLSCSLPFSMLFFATFRSKNTALIHCNMVSWPASLSLCCRVLLRLYRFAATRFVFIFSALLHFAPPRLFLSHSFLI